MAVCDTLDEYIREYFVYRGFHSTLKAFDNDIKNDKHKSFRIDRVVETMTAFINSYDLSSLKEYWNFLDHRIFGRVQQVMSSTVHKMEVNLFRLYMVNAMQNGRTEKVQEFLEKQANESGNQSDWRDWFALPYTKQPEDTPMFGLYFTKTWQDTFLLSLSNFLSMAFHSMPLPTLLCVEKEAELISDLREQVKFYTIQVEALMRRGVEARSYGEYKRQVSRHGLHSEDIMEDFFLISQSSQRIENDSQQSSSSQSASSQIKSFVKSISSSSTPANSKKQSIAQSNTSTKSPSLVKRSVSAKVKVKESKSTPQGTPPVAHSPKRKPPEASTLSSETESKNPPQEVTKRSPLAENAPNVASPFLLLSAETYAEHQAAVSQCVISKGSVSVASVDVDGVVKVWSVQPQPTTLATVMSKSVLSCLDWVPQSHNQLLLGNKAGSVRLFDVKNKKTVAECNIESNYPRIISLACAPTSDSFVCSCLDRSGHVDPGGGSAPANSQAGALYVMDIATLKLQSVLPLEPKSSYVNNVSYSADGSLILAACSDGMIRLYDCRSKDCASAWQSHEGEVYCAQLDPTNSACYSMGSDGKFVRWELKGATLTADKRQELAVHSGATGPFIQTGATGLKQVQTPRSRIFCCDAQIRHAITCDRASTTIYQFGSSGGIWRCMTLGGHVAPVTALDWTQSADYRTCISGAMDGRVVVSTLLMQENAQ